MWPWRGGGDDEGQDEQVHGTEVKVSFGTPAAQKDAECDRILESKGGPSPASCGRQETVVLMPGGVGTLGTLSTTSLLCSEHRDVLLAVWRVARR